MESKALDPRLRGDDKLFSAALTKQENADMSMITFDTQQLIAELATSKAIRALEQSLREMELRFTMKIGTLIVAALGFFVAIQKII